MTAPSLPDLRARLLASRDPAGPWRSTLSSSPLGNAVALIALVRSQRAGGPHQEAVEEVVQRGLAWLIAHQNEDGGYGDTPDSVSNLSTSLLAWGALGLLLEGAEVCVARLDAYLGVTVSPLEPHAIAGALNALYGDDQTFSAPILTALALSGRMGEGAEAWRYVPALPFELAAVPASWWPWLNLRVVSYALPALIAIGQVRQHHRPTRGPLGWLREALRAKTLTELTAVQPETGGFLEAIPLTAFVLMSLASMGQEDHPVAARGVGFLIASQREDGSWPIDMNLDIWVTTLSVGALGTSVDAVLSPSERQGITDWLLDQQLKVVHPFTHAEPGGWAWTDLPGGVPDADDTPSALLALRALAPGDPAVVEAAERGINWLLDLQNRDGGIPTFCRGWGTLPFDASSPDLTAHALRAWTAWRDDLSASTQARVDRGIDRGIRFLFGEQREDGRWVPLWFGNQAHPEGENPVYGTSRVLRAVKTPGGHKIIVGNWKLCMERGARWLVSVQGPEGGWGADAGVAPSLEETALALEALAEVRHLVEVEVELAIEAGMAWLRAAVARDPALTASPIGLYFASLWYSEAMYPLIWTVSAMQRVETSER